MPTVSVIGLEEATKLEREADEQRQRGMVVISI